MLSNVQIMVLVWLSICYLVVCMNINIAVVNFCLLIPAELLYDIMLKGVLHIYIWYYKINSASAISSLGEINQTISFKWEACYDFQGIAMQLQQCYS
jgi:hypothetical protein